MRIIRQNLTPNPELKAAVVEGLIAEGVELYGPFWKAVWTLKAYEKSHGRNISWLAASITIKVLRRDVRRDDPAQKVKAK